ncbi:MAG: phosphatase PAP2 family protein [Elusimicrobia bacterium]|nr:phosphatase PAP2 family protein [Elusimicrobiota bacterium]
MTPLATLLLSLASALWGAEPARYAWDPAWPRFRKTELAVTGAAVAGAAANFYLVKPPETAAWKGPILFDKGAREVLIIRSQSSGDRAELIGDLLTFPLIGYAMLDGPLTALWAGGNKDTAGQLALINAETFAVTEVLNLSISNAFPRARPDGAVCDPRSRYDPRCVKSFWSGHAANVFAAASLVCVQHQALELYGGAADAAVCAASLTAAAGVALLRVASNDHYASDILVGAALGAATGYLMPKLLHFRPRSDPGLGRLEPRAVRGGGGLAWVRRW